MGFKTDVTLPNVSLLVCERDVDLFLVEEFVSSAAFLSWFLSRVGISGSARLIDVSRSVTTSIGESDLEVTVALGKSITKVLIENKIDAALQPRQSERYAERGAAYCAGGKCNSVVTVLVAPEAYMGIGEGQQGFQKRVSYESILGWHTQHEPPAPRALYKRQILQRAIKRSETGYTLTPDPTATSFWDQYYQLATREAPELAMKPPGQRGSGAGWVYFNVRRGVNIIHKMPLGSVDLQLARYGERVLDFRRRYEAELEPGMMIVRTGKSLVVRISVPAIQLETPFPLCEAAALEGIRAVSRLFDWEGRVLARTLTL